MDSQGENQVYEAIPVSVLPRPTQHRADGRQAEKPGVFSLRYQRMESEAARISGNRGREIPEQRKPCGRMTVGVGNGGTQNLDLNASQIAG